MTSVLFLPVAEQYPSRTDTSVDGASKRTSHMPSVTRRESNKKVPSAKHRHNHRRHGGMRSDGGDESCGHLPAESAQWVTPDRFRVVDYRQPVRKLIHRAIALRTLPPDVKVAVLRSQSRLQIDAGNADIAVRGITPRTLCACAAASDRPAEAIPIGLADGLLASASVVGHASHSATLRAIQSVTHADIRT